MIYRGFQKFTRAYVGPYVPGCSYALSDRQLGTLPSFILGDIIATYSLQKLLCIALTCRSGSMACTVAMRPDQLDRETESRSCQKSYIDFITLACIYAFIIVSNQLKAVYVLNLHTFVCMQSSSCQTSKTGLHTEFTYLINTVFMICNEF